MKILVLNCGSSSIKYRVYEDKKALAEGLIERIGEKGSRIKDYHHAIRIMAEEIINSGKLEKIGEIKAVGHRVVHGGEISKSCVINKKIIEAIKKNSKFAPLHNPVNLKGIYEMKKILPKAKHIAVFDTAFHQTMPEHAFVYAIPYEFCRKEGIRRYGFHGTSHYYVAKRAEKILGKRLNAITVHLGAGCSMAAVRKGKVMDTSMGMTPLEGLVMGTRCGDIDAGVLIHLGKKMKTDEIDNLLNKKSGLAGISGKGKDMRTILKHYKKDKRCRLAVEIFCYRIKKYIGAYAAALGKLDAIVFTAGIGENSPLIRRLSLPENLGIRLDSRKNNKIREGAISSGDSKIKVLVIPTDEEKVIAEETRRLA